MIKLFDVQNNVIIPTEHCYVLKTLAAVKTEFPECYVKAYAYLFYVTCPNPEINPFFDVPEDDKEEMILHELQPLCFSPEDKVILKAVEFCKKLYETPTSRAFYGIKTMLDNLALYMKDTTITDGRDGNINSLVSAAKSFQAIRESYKGTFRDLMDEQSSSARGGARLAYDQ